MPCTPGQGDWASPEGNAKPLKSFEQEAWRSIKLPPVAVCRMHGGGGGAEGLPRQPQNFRPELMRGLAGVVSKKGRKKTHSKCKNQIEKDRGERHF